MVTLVAAAFALGLVFNAAPGPVFAETVRRGTGGGFRPALGVQLGSLVGDALCAVIGLTGVGVLSQGRWLRLAVGVAGAGYLGWLAIDACRESLRGGLAERYGAAASGRKALGSGVLLSLTNPQNVAYWAALGISLQALGARDPGPGDYAAFFLGFMLSSLVWAFVFAALVDRFLGRAGRVWYRATHGLCAALFLVLAVSSIEGAVVVG